MNPIFTPEESEQYMKVLNFGTKKDMFDFAYTLGQQHQIEKSLKLIKELGIGGYTNDI